MEKTYMSIYFVTASSFLALIRYYDDNRSHIPRRS